MSRVRKQNPRVQRRSRAVPVQAAIDARSAINKGLALAIYYVCAVRTYGFQSVWNGRDRAGLEG